MCGMLRKYTLHTYTTFQVNSDESGRQSKMAANSKSNVVSQTAYARLNGNFYAICEMPHGVKVMKQSAKYMCYYTDQCRKNDTAITAYPFNTFWKSHAPL